MPWKHTECVEVKLHTFGTCALARGMCSISHSSPFTQGKETGWAQDLCGHGVKKGSLCFCQESNSVYEFHSTCPSWQTWWHNWSHTV